jgi:hypothetical protein
MNSITGGELMDIPDSKGRRLGWGGCIVRRRNRRRHQKILESGRRKHEEIVIFDVAGIAQLVRDVARRHESVTRSKNEDLVSHDDLEFSTENIIDFILTRMRVTRHDHARCETNVEETVCSTGVGAGQTYATNAHVEVITFGSPLMLD